MLDTHKIKGNTTGCIHRGICPRPWSEDGSILVYVYICIYIRTYIYVYVFSWPGQQPRTIVIHAYKTLEVGGVAYIHTCIYVHTYSYVHAQCKRFLVIKWNAHTHTQARPRFIYGCKMYTINTYVCMYVCIYIHMCMHTLYGLKFNSAVLLAALGSAATLPFFKLLLLNSCC